jgi:hypothetical protein
MQRYTIFFIVVNALHVSGGFSAHHRELKIQKCTHSIWYMSSLLAVTASVGELELKNAIGNTKQTGHIPDAVCIVLNFKLLMMGGETARK